MFCLPKSLYKYIWRPIYSSATLVYLKFMKTILKELEEAAAEDVMTDQ